MSKIEMRKWTFTGAKGGYTTVEAFTEQEARNKAMWERHGAPEQYPLHILDWSGEGLHLVTR